jgi:hypothetical protein
MKGHAADAWSTVFTAYLSNSAAGRIPGHGDPFDWRFV